MDFLKTDENGKLTDYLKTQGQPSIINIRGDYVFTFFINHKSKMSSFEKGKS